MQDKEFDKVFKSKFEDFNVGPAPMVWDNIAGELDRKKTKRAIMPWLSIAATILVLLTAGVLFLKQKGDTAVQHGHAAKLVSNNVGHVMTTTPGKVHTAPVIVVQHSNRVASTKAHNAPAGTSPASAVVPENVIVTDNTVKDAEPIKTESHNITQNFVPGKQTQLAAKPLDLEQQPPVAKPVIAAISKQDVAVVKKHGIHSLGGLINVLVAKVDKRQDKLIEFTDNDDDDTESSITGVNLGIIKVKKQ